jgi:hypothetical protein
MLFPDVLSLQCWLSFFPTSLKVQNHVSIKPIGFDHYTAIKDYDPLIPLFISFK